MKSSNRSGSVAYQGAFEAVLAIPVGAGLGYWFDTLLGSAPVGVLLGVAFGFGAFVLLIVRLTRRLRELRSEEEGENPPPPALDAWSDPWDEDDWSRDPWDAKSRDRQDAKEGDGAPPNDGGGRDRKG